MISADRKKFGELLENFFAVIGSQFNQGVMPWWFDALAGYELNHIKTAMQAYTADPKRERGPVLPATILGYLPSLLGHPTPEQAWNHAPKSERCCGWVTSEMMQALADCDDSLRRGDTIAARMAFIESYKARVRAAEAQKIPAKFFFSSATALSHEQRLQAKETKTIEAMKNGWITQDQAKTVVAAISQELGKASPQALELLGELADSKRLRIENISNETGKALKTLPAPRSNLIDLYGEIKKRLADEQRCEDEKTEERSKKLEERRKLLLSQAAMYTKN